jgi:deoxyadenosine/deoxycytidine kinase
MDINIDIIGTTGEGKTAICYMLKEFFENLTDKFQIEIKDDDSVKELIWKDWEKYKVRFTNSFKDKDLKINIKTYQANRKSKNEDKS